jgi:uncharacterized protein YcaQ
MIPGGSSAGEEGRAKLSLARARKMMVAAQGLDGGWRLPRGNYRFYLPRMRAYRSSPRIRAFLEANAPLVANVLARIRSEGGLRSADFDAPPDRKPGTWWDWKPAKRALEALYSVGELMVSERRGFQRVYDLPERVLPAEIDTSEPDPHEVTRFFLRQLLKTQGVSALQQRQVRDRSAVAATLRELVESGEVTPIQVDGIDAPEPKRRYGYFCLPILWGDRFVGRLDPKAERRERTLVVRRLLLESGLRDRDALWPDLAAELTAFASFNGCEEIRIEDTRPRSAGAALRRALREVRTGPTSR